MSLSSLRQILGDASKQLTVAIDSNDLDWSNDAFEAFVDAYKAYVEENNATIAGTN
jgi:hypothetical protein